MHARKTKTEAKGLNREQEGILIPFLDAVLKHAANEKGLRIEEIETPNQLTDHCVGVFTTAAILQGLDVDTLIYARVSALKPTPQTLGEALAEIKRQAKLIRNYLQDEIEDQAEDEEADNDSDHILDFLLDVYSLPTPTKAVQALQCDPQPLQGRTNLDKAKSLSAALQSLSDTFKKSKIEDPDFAEALDEIEGWLGDL